MFFVNGDNLHLRAMQKLVKLESPRWTKSRLNDDCRFQCVCGRQQTRLGFAE